MPEDKEIKEEKKEESKQEKQEKQEKVPDKQSEELKEEKQKEEKQKEEKQKEVSDKQPEESKKEKLEKPEEQKLPAEKGEVKEEKAKAGGLLTFIFKYKFAILIFVVIFIVGLVALFLFIKKGKKAEQFRQNVAVGKETLNVDFSKNSPVEPDNKKKINAIRTMVEKASGELPTFTLGHMVITEDSPRQSSLRFTFDVEVDSEETVSHLKSVKNELEKEIKGKVSKMDYSELFTDDGRNKLKILLQNIIRSKLQDGMLIRNIYFSEFLVT